jgi:hypothetical protein
MKAFYALAVPFALTGAAVLLSAPSANAANYLSSGYSGGYGGSANYLNSYGGGGFSGGNKLTNYGSGGYSPGGGYTMVNYGYSSGSQSPDTPHRSTWGQYTQLKAEYEAETYSVPLCGTFHSRTANYCHQSTTAWNPLSNQ